MEKVIGLYGETIKVPCNYGNNKPVDLMFTKWKHVSLCSTFCLNLSVLDHWRPAVRCQENQSHWWRANWWISGLYRPAIVTVTPTKDPSILLFLFLFLAVSLFCWQRMTSQLRTGAVKELSAWQIGNSRAFMLLSIVEWERHLGIRYPGEAGTEGRSEDHSYRQL